MLLKGTSVTDSHVHIFPEPVIRNRTEFLDDVSFALLYANEKSRLAGARDITNYINTYSLEKVFALGFSWESPERCEMHNRELLAASNETIIPFACVPGHPVKDVGGMCAHIADSGFAGIGEIAFYTDGLTTANADYLYELFAACAQHGLIAVLHVNEPLGHNYPGKYQTDFGILYKIISGNPDTRIILSHFGGGIFLFESMPEVRSAFTNVYYDTAASPYIYDEKIFSALISVGAGKRLLFGTDYPLMKPEKFTALFEKADLDSTISDDIMSFNLKRITENIDNIY